MEQNNNGINNDGMTPAPSNLEMPEQGSNPINNSTPSVSPVSETPGIPTAAPAQEVSAIPEAAPAQTVVDTSKAPEVAVINTTKEKKGGSTLLIVLLVLLVLFVFNMNTVINLFNNIYNSIFSKQEVVKNPNDGDNLLDGYILINEDSSVETDNIKFYAFKKNDDVLSFTYNASQKIEDVAILSIFIELYNANKEVLYKEIFNVKPGIDKEVVKSYQIVLEDDIKASVYYARIRKYTDAEYNSTQTLTCSQNLSEGDIKATYNITYNFKNNELMSYNVSKEATQSIPTAQTNIDETTNNEGITTEVEKNKYEIEIENEYSSLPASINGNLTNGKLTYTVNLENEIADYIPLYKKGAIITVVKMKETDKGWVCK